MKLSFITTVYNEEKDIAALLESILAQTKLPGEIVIVDAGSNDKTVKKINGYKLKIKESGVKFKLLIKKGNRASGRNFAIENSIGDIIVCSDVGCILDKNFIKNIVRPFKNKKVDVVAGFYHAKVRNTFEKCLSTYTCVMPDKVDPGNFLPSSRSIAFKKSVWKRIGGYPEYLDTCEDLVFASSIKRKGFRFEFVENAFVLWPQRENIFQAATQLFNYAVGDGRALYIRKNTPLLFGRYAIGLILTLLFLATKNQSYLLIIIGLVLMYLVWAVSKNYRHVNKVSALVYLPILQFTADFAVLGGTILGVINNLWDIRSKS